MIAEPDRRPDAVPDALAQQQFLNVLSRDEAMARFLAALQPGPVGRERIPLAAALGRIAGGDIAAAIDVPPFDRSLVDGFAVRAADIEAAAEGRPVSLGLNSEVIACGVAPRQSVVAGVASPIATGGPLPRGADAVVMVEQTETTGGRLAVRRPVAAGAHVAFAGSDIVAGETLVRGGTRLGAREIGMLAAAGRGDVDVLVRPRVAIVSTGDELVAPGGRLGPAQIYDSNGPILAAAVTEEGCLAVPYGVVPDERAALSRVIAAAHGACDALILSGGTSKGAGDLTYRLIEGLGEPGIVAHGVALKPGKPLLLAVCGGKPVIVLPGFPTSAMLTFHDIVAPVLRQMAGLPPRVAAEVSATLPTRLPSELGRTEYVMVALTESGGGYAAYPTGKGSGAVTSFSQADGFVTVDALADSLPAGSACTVRLFSPSVIVPDLVIMGSHCVGLEAMTSRLAGRGVATRVLAIGSMGGLAAAKRGECDLAPMHVLDPASGVYNRPYLAPGLELVEGWRRMQGFVHRADDPRFAGLNAEAAVAAALADPDCHMVNRNAGAGTRILIDALLAGARPDGYANQPKSHNAVAAAIAQGRADWGIAIKPPADGYGLAFIPLGEEHYDFAVVGARRARSGVAGFLALLDDPDIRAGLRAMGFRPASDPVLAGAS